MQTVRTLPTEVNETSETVLNWVSQKAARFEIPSTTARLWANAIRQLTAVLDDQDAKDPKSLLENAEEITRRYTLKTGANGETAKTYESRLLSSVGNYLAWKEDPTAWRYKEKEKKEKRPAKAASKAAELPEKAPEPTTKQTKQTEPEAPLPPGAVAQEMRTYPLGDGSVFAFVLPSEGITVSDAFKIAMHVATFARDYDPGSRVHEALRAMVVGSPSS
jgi:hypothetical protein